MRRLSAIAALIAITAACAHMEAPPGGPIRRVPIKLLGTVPESLVASPGFRGDAAFIFDEVVSEGTQPNFGRGTGDLERRVMLSPDTLVPVVEWHRNRITVRPRHGWRPNTVYWVELLPGIADLHNNPSRITYRATVVTSDTVPNRYISGRIINWSVRSAVPNALVIARRVNDSLRYRDLADSTGRFRLGPLPPGSYLIEGVSDQNNDHRRNDREMWDSVRVGLAGDSAGEIWIFQRDTLAPKAQGPATRTDSVTITVTLTNPVDPAQTLPADSIRVGLLPDTLNTGPLGEWSKSIYDSLFKPAPPVKPVPKTAADSARVITDSIKAHNDSVQRAGIAAAAAARNLAAGGRPAPRPDPPQQKRLPLGNDIIIRTRGVLTPGSKYYVEVRGVRLANGRTGTVIARLDVPAPAPVDTTKAGRAKADSLKADSLARSRPDSARRPR